MPHNLNTDGQLRSLWMGDENCVEGDLRGQAPPHSLSLTSHTPLHTVLIPHPLTVSVWGGGLGSGGWATTPQRHKLEGWRTVMEGEEWGGGGGCERSSATLSNGQFIQKHRGGNSKIAAIVTRIHYTPSPEALNFTTCLLLWRQISLRAFSYGA